MRVRQVRSTQNESVGNEQKNEYKNQQNEQTRVIVTRGWTWKNTQLNLNVKFRRKATGFLVIPDTIITPYGAATYRALENYLRTGATRLQQVAVPA